MENLNSNSINDKESIRVIKCQTCGGSEEVEGDFVAYEYGYRADTTYGASIKTTLREKFSNIMPFTFRACLDCTRSKLFGRLRLYKILTYVLLCYGVLALAHGIYGIKITPLHTRPAPVFYVTFISGFLALLSLAFPIGQYKDHKALLPGFPQDRVQVSKALLQLFKQRIIACAMTYNPAVYRKNYLRVVSHHEWTREIASKGILVSKIAETKSAEQERMEAHAFTPQQKAEEYRARLEGEARRLGITYVLKPGRIFKNPVLLSTEALEAEILRVNPSFKIGKKSSPSSAQHSE
jgi:hypothetical protein